MTHLALIFSYFQSKMLLNVVSKSPHIHIRVQVIGRINGRFKRSESDQMEGIGEIIKKKKKKTARRRRREISYGSRHRRMLAIIFVELVGASDVIRWSESAWIVIEL